MDIMSGRAATLEIVLQNFNQGIAPHFYISQVAAGDDIGIYYFIPLLAHFLHISSTAATELFWQIIITLALSVAFICIFVHYKNWIIRLLSICCLYSFSIYIYHVGDLYIAAPALTMAVIPFAIYLLNNNQQTWINATFIMLCGFAIGIFQYIRSFSATPLLAFILFMLIFNKKISAKLKGLFICMLSIGILLPSLYFKSLLQESENYYHHTANNYLYHHPFWHPIYLGLGYLPNPYGINWANGDHMADLKTHSIDKNVVVYSPEYEKILRDQVLQIAQQNPKFIIHTLIAKAFKLFNFAHNYLIIAFIFTILFPKGWRIEIAFWSLLFLSALPGLLVMPEIAYVLGFVAAAIMYMLVSIGYALDILISPITEKECSHSRALNFLTPKLNNFLSGKNQFSQQLHTLVLQLRMFLKVIS